MESNCDATEAAAAATTTTTTTTTTAIAEDQTQIATPEALVQLALERLQNPKSTSFSAAETEYHDSATQHSDSMSAEGPYDETEMTAEFDLNDTSLVVSWIADRTIDDADYDVNTPDIRSAWERAKEQWSVGADDADDYDEEASEEYCSTDVNDDASGTYGNPIDIASSSDNGHYTDDEHVSAYPNTAFSHFPAMTSSELVQMQSSEPVAGGELGILASAVDNVLGTPDKIQDNEYSKAYEMAGALINVANSLYDEQMNEGADTSHDNNGIVNSAEADDAITKESSYQRPPIPPKDSNAGHTLGQMKEEIDNSIARSLEIVADIVRKCEQAETAAENSEAEAEEDVATAFDEYAAAFESEITECLALVESAVTRYTELDAKSQQAQQRADKTISNLTCELAQLKESASEALSKAATLESEALSSQAQTNALKSTIRNIAQKHEQLNQSLAQCKTALRESQTMCAVTNQECGQLKAKNKSLADSLDTLTRTLKDSESKYQCVSRDLAIARDRNASEQLRISLERRAKRLDDKCTALTSALSQSQKSERLLVSSNRALEARLRDALRKLDEPVLCPDDVLTDYRRNWDRQMLKMRKEMADMQCRLKAAESALAAEKDKTHQQQVRISGLERRLSGSAVDEQADDESKKRKRQESDSSVGSDKIVEVAGGVSTMVSAGEFARGRRRVHGLVEMNGESPLFMTPDRSKRDQLVGTNKIRVPLGAAMTYNVGSCERPSTPRVNIGSSTKRGLADRNGRYFVMTPSSKPKNSSY